LNQAKDLLSKVWLLLDFLMTSRFINILLLLVVFKLYRKQDPAFSKLRCRKDGKKKQVESYKKGSTTTSSEDDSDIREAKKKEQKINKQNKKNKVT